MLTAIMAQINSVLLRDVDGCASKREGEREISGQVETCLTYKKVFNGRSKFLQMPQSRTPLKTVADETEVDLVANHSQIFNALPGGDSMRIILNSFIQFVPIYVTNI